MQKIWFAILAVLTGIALYMIFGYAPLEIHQGMVQKVFYIHVSSAIGMYGGFMLGAIAAVLYLATRQTKFDYWSMASIEVGLLFCTIVLVTGPIWAKPIWGSWWSWDPRLTSTFFLWLIFVSYFLLRQALVDSARARTYGAILAIFGTLDIPIIMVSVKLWRGIHPDVAIGRGGLPPEMYATFIMTTVVILLLALTLIFERTKNERMRHEHR